MELWEQQPQETDKAYAAFQAYIALEPLERSIDKAYQKSVKNISGGKTRNAVWLDWSSKHNWVERAKAYDKHLLDLEQKAIQAAIQERAAIEAVKWQKRQDEIREREFSVAEKLLEKANAMLDFPLTRKEAEVDGERFIIMPARWNFASAARLLEVASKLGRLSSGLATDRTELDITPQDIENMTDQELDEYIKRAEQAKGK